MTRGTATSTTLYIHDIDDHIISETNTAGRTLREYIWLNDIPIAVVDNVETATPTLYYVHSDHLARPARIMAQDGSAVWDVIYSPFGAVSYLWSAAGFDGMDLRFPGQWFQLETGLAYNWHRHYDATLGRYAQADPIGLKGGGNIFAYVGGSPLTSTDPRGENSFAIRGIILGGEAGSGLGPFGTIAGGIVGGIGGYLIGDQLGDWIFNNNGKPPRDAADPNGPKAPGQPGPDEGFCPPKKGQPLWGKSPNGRGSGWIDADGNIWVPTGHGPDAHGGPHWDVQKPGGGYDNIYPGGFRRPGS